MLFYCQLSPTVTSEKVLHFGRASASKLYLIWVVDALQYTSCKTKSEVMTIFPSGLRAYQKTSQDFKMPKKSFRLQESHRLPGRRGILYGFEFSALLACFKITEMCAKENFGITLEGSELSGKRLLWTDFGVFFCQTIL